MQIRLIAWSLSLASVWKVMAPLQPCSHYCLCILILSIQLCFYKKPFILWKIKAISIPLFWNFFKNPFTNYHLKRISTSVFWKISPLLLYTADFLCILANIFSLLFYIGRFFRFLWTKFKIFIISPSLLYKADFFQFLQPKFYIFLNSSHIKTKNISF